DVAFRRVLPLEAEGIQALLIRFDPVRREFGVYSRRHAAAPGADDAPWGHHAGGWILAGDANGAGGAGGSGDPGSPRVHDLAALRRRRPDRLAIAGCYAPLPRAGLTYGPTFPVVKEVRRGEGSVWARLERAATASSEEGESAYRLHPTILDGCFQARLATI